jgi:chaperone required for assembly of F1-ATPase
MKRFYREAVAVAAANGYVVRLDGKTLTTPAKTELGVPSRALAEAIAAEWQNQSLTVSPLALPLTRLGCTAIDRVAPRRAEMVVAIADYAATDLLCYRAAEPPALAARQHAIWQPLLDWAEQRFAARLAITHGIAPIAQAPAALEALRRAIAAHDAMALVALHLATASCGSVVLGLAVLERRLAPDDAFAAAELDASFQIERWGEEPEAAKRRDGVRQDIALAARFAGLLRDE